MVSAISSTAFNPIAYLQQIKGVTPVAPAKPTTPTTTPSTDETGGDAQANVASLITSLLGLSSDALSVLQGGDSGGQSNIFTALLGAKTETSADPLAGVYGSLESTGTQSANYEDAIKAILDAPKPQAASSTINNAISANINAYNSYNQTLIKTAQDVLKSYQPNSGTNLVA